MLLKFNKGTVPYLFNKGTVPYLFNKGTVPYLFNAFEVSHERMNKTDNSKWYNWKYQTT